MNQLIHVAGGVLQRPDNRRNLGETLRFASCYQKPGGPCEEKAVETACMKLLLVALELGPYASSAAADATAQLAKALRLLDHEVTVVVPRLAAYQDAGIFAARQLTPLHFEEPVPGKAHVHEAALSSGVRFVQLETPGAEFERELPLEEQLAPLAQFGRAAGAFAQVASETSLPFDVVLAMEPFAGLSLLHVERSSALSRVLVVRDAERAGVHPASATETLQLPPGLMDSQGFLQGEELCLLKGLLAHADTVVVPSDNYARKLQAPNLQGALSRAFRAAPLVGIEEGVDYSVYNPATDSALHRRFDAVHPEDKGRNRSKSLTELELSLDLARPVLFAEPGSGGDVAWSTLLSSIPALVRNHCSLILGSADDQTREAAESFPGEVVALAQPQGAERRRLLAAADFYLSLRRHEPTGVELLQAARYGAIPIALCTDAAVDLVVDADAELQTGTGILYGTMSQRSLQTAAARAVAAFHHSRFEALLRRTMRLDYSWDRTARRHVQLYRSLLRLNV